MWKMKYMLVIQFPHSDMDDFNAMIRLEDELCHLLRYFAVVDGHDCGRGEMNIFVFTNEPQEAFDRAKIAIENFGLLHNMSAAYRLVEGEEHVRLWPVGSTQPFIVT